MLYNVGFKKRRQVFRKKIILILINEYARQTNPKKNSYFTTVK